MRLLPEQFLEDVSTEFYKLVKVLSAVVPWCRGLANAEFVFIKHLWLGVMHSFRNKRSQIVIMESNTLGKEITRVCLILLLDC